MICCLFGTSKKDKHTQPDEANGSGRKRNSRVEVLQGNVDEAPFVSIPISLPGDIQRRSSRKHQKGVNCPAVDSLPIDERNANTEPRNPLAPPSQGLLIEAELQVSEGTEETLYQLDEEFVTCVPPMSSLSFSSSQQRKQLPHQESPAAKNFPLTSTTSEDSNIMSPLISRGLNTCGGSNVRRQPPVVGGRTETEETQSLISSLLCPHAMSSDVNASHQHHTSSDGSNAPVPAEPRLVSSIADEALSRPASAGSVKQRVSFRARALMLIENDDAMSMQSGPIHLHDSVPDHAGLHSTSASLRTSGVDSEHAPLGQLSALAPVPVALVPLTHADQMHRHQLAQSRAFD